MYTAFVQVTGYPFSTSTVEDSEYNVCWDILSHFVLSVFAFAAKWTSGSLCDGK